MILSASQMPSAVTWDSSGSTINTLYEPRGALHGDLSPLLGTNAEITRSKSELLTLYSLNYTQIVAECVALKD